MTEAVIGLASGSDTIGEIHTRMIDVYCAKVKLSIHNAHEVAVSSVWSGGQWSSNCANAGVGVRSRRVLVAIMMYVAQIIALVIGTLAVKIMLVTGQESVGSEELRCCFATATTAMLKVVEIKMAGLGH